MSSIIEMRKQLDPKLIQYIEERVLHFKLLCDDDITKVKNILDKTKIEYICGDKDSYYDFEFFIRRGHRTWKNIKDIIESVEPTFYDYAAVNAVNFRIVSKRLYIYDGKFMDVCV